MPASELATAMPRSSWQCTLIVAFWMLGTFSRMARISAAELLGNCVAGGVGDVDDGCAGINRRLQHFEQVGGVGAAGVFGVELHVVGVTAGPLDRVDGHLHHLDLLLAQSLAVALISELAHDVNVGDADAGMDTRPLRFGQSFAASLDVRGHGSRQSANHRPFDLLRDQLDGLEIIRRGSGISRLDNVDFEPRQLACQGQLVASSKTCSRRLFAIPQRRVKHCYFRR